MAIRRLLALLIAALGIALVTAPAPAHAETALSEEDRADAARIERYLDAIRSMRANFLQINPDGSIAEGRFFLSRPGKIRFDYDPPTPIVVVGDGIWLHYHDKELGQINDYPISDTPIALLVKDRIRFEEPVRITEVVREPGAVHITLFDAKDPGRGSLSLSFSDRPLELKNWSIIDPQGRVTRVAFVDVRTNIEIEPDLFVFDDPRQKVGPGRSLR